MRPLLSPALSSLGGRRRRRQCRFGGGIKMRTPIRHSELKHCGGSYRCATKLAMLYQRWREISETHGREVALRELGSGRRWTFAQLAKTAERAPAAAGDIAFPQGRSA